MKFDALSGQNKHVSNSPVDNQPKEVRELTECLLRKHHLESQIIGDPKDKVQTRNSLKHTTLLSEIKPKHIDDVVCHNQPYDRRAKSEKKECIFQEGKRVGVTTNVYSRKTLEKPKRKGL